MLESSPDNGVEFSRRLPERQPPKTTLNSRLRLKGVVGVSVSVCRSKLFTQCVGSFQITPSGFIVRYRHIVEINMLDRPCGCLDARLRQTLDPSQFLLEPSQDLSQNAHRARRARRSEVPGRQGRHTNRRYASFACAAYSKRRQGVIPKY
jgi:hypothetical protein